MNNILENKKILLVDDNDFNRMIINIHLKKYNIIIKEAEDGNEAAKILENESFDIISGLKKVMNSYLRYILKTIDLVVIKL